MFGCRAVCSLEYTWLNTASNKNQPCCSLFNENSLALRGNGERASFSLNRLLYKHIIVRICTYEQRYVRQESTTTTVEPISDTQQYCMKAHKEKDDAERFQLQFLSLLRGHLGRDWSQLFKGNPGDKESFLAVVRQKVFSGLSVRKNTGLLPPWFISDNFLIKTPPDMTPAVLHSPYDVNQKHRELRQNVKKASIQTTGVNFHYLKYSTL